MKIVKLFSILLIIISATLTLSRKNLKNRKLKNKAAVCTHIKYGKDGAVIEISSDPNEAVYPSDYQNTQAKTKATNQAKASRKFYLSPNAAAKKVLQDAAKGLQAFIQANSGSDSKIISINRQIDQDGSLSSYYRSLQEIVNTELDAGGETASDLNVEWIVNHVIATVVGDKATSNDYVGFVSLIGDIGATVQDRYGREKTQDKMSPQEWTMAETMGNHNVILGKSTIKKLSEYSKTVYAYGSPDNFYDIKTDKNKRGKQAERATCMKDNEKLSLTRASIFDKGEAADQLIVAEAAKNPAKKDLIAKMRKIPKIAWPLQTVPKSIIDKCKDEPFAGHFSGSLYEVLLMLDVLTGANPLPEAKGTDDRKAKAAIAAAALIATGFHSAVEINFVIRRYLGIKELTNPKQIIIDSTDEWCKDASKEIIELIESFIEPF